MLTCYYAAFREQARARHFDVGEEEIQNVLNQGVDTESQDLDLLRHDLENDIIGEYSQ